MKAFWLLWMLCGLGLLLLPASAQQSANATATSTSAPAAIAASSTPGPPASTKINGTATTSPSPPIQIVQTQTKSSNATNLAKEHDALKSKANATIEENVPKGRRVKITDTPTVRPDVKLKSATAASSPSSSTTLNSTNTTTTNIKLGKEQIISGDGVSSSVIGNFTQAVNKLNATKSTTPTVPTTTTTTTSTTTPHSKPKVVFSMDMHPEWEKDQDQHQPLAANVAASSSVPSSSTLPEPDPPMVQPSQELTGNLADRGGNEYIVPIVTVLLTVPLAIGVAIVMYRRFREMWSTRHYRRMDFLVDGMYND